MFWNKRSTSVKGYTLAYTMIAGLIIIMLAGFGFSAEVKRRINIEKYEKTVEEKKCSSGIKEFLFSKMNNFVISRASIQSRDDVKKILYSIAEGNKIGCSDCYIFYNKDFDKFIIRVISTKGVTRDYKYDYCVVDGNIKYVFISIN